MVQAEEDQSHQIHCSKVMAVLGFQSDHKYAELLLRLDAMECLCRLLRRFPDVPEVTAAVPDALIALCLSTSPGKKSYFKNQNNDCHQPGKKRAVVVCS